MSNQNTLVYTVLVVLDIVLAELLAELRSEVSGELGEVVQQDFILDPVLANEDLGEGDDSAPVRVLSRAGGGWVGLVMLTTERWRCV